MSGDGSPYTEGSYVVYTCDPGYTMLGDTDYVIRVCKTTEVEGLMEWSGPNVQCQGLCRLDFVLVNMQW